MKKTLSSPIATFIDKFIYSAISIGVFGLGTLWLFLEGRNERWVFLIAWIALTVIIYYSCAKLKVVKVDDNLIYISNYFKEISVPYSDIEKVHEYIFTAPRVIRIEFKHNTVFGRTIIFVAKGIVFFLISHPVVRELREMVQKSKP